MGKQVEMSKSILWQGLRGLLLRVQVFPRCSLTSGLLVVPNLVLTGCVFSHAGALLMLRFGNSWCNPNLS